MDIKFDEVGRWTEIKLEILRKYAQAYSTILTRQIRLEHFYIDGFRSRDSSHKGHRRAHRG